MKKIFRFQNPQLAKHEPMINLLQAKKVSANKLPKFHPCPCMCPRLCTLQSSGYTQSE
jgi:hypothetical protein